MPEIQGLNMPAFSLSSLSKLSTCHPDLQTLFAEVIKHFDCKVLEGHRGEAAQNKAFDEGKSKLRWPDGNHNKIPSMAVDVAPYDPPTTINWKDINRFYYFGGFVMGVAKILKIQGKITHDIRWGGDWDMDTQVNDNTFNDLVHFELV